MINLIIDKFKCRVGLKRDEKNFAGVYWCPICKKYHRHYYVIKRENITNKNDNSITKR